MRCEVTHQRAFGLGRVGRGEGGYEGVMAKGESTPRSEKEEPDEYGARDARLSVSC